MIEINTTEQCKSCNKEIVFLLTSKGNRMPIDAETVSPHETHYNKDVHTSHFATCPDANKFRRKK